MAAPVTAIIAYDLEFYEKLPRLFPHTDARSWYAGKSAEHIRSNAFRGRDAAGPYLIIAARALGLDCGPIGGFDAAKVDAAFFQDGKIKSNFLCNLGHGRRRQAPSAQPAAGLRRGLPDRVRDRAAAGPAARHGARANTPPVSARPALHPLAQRGPRAAC